MSDVSYAGSSSSGNWNIAPDYSKHKIARHLVEIDEHIMIALYGTSNLVDEFYIDEPMKNMARIKALQRLATNVSMLIENTIFALKETKKDELRTFLKQVQDLEKLIPKLMIIAKNQKQRTTTVSINEEGFATALLALRQIHSELLEPLNKANLIFMAKEEFDIDEIKKQLYEEAVERG